MSSQATKQTLHENALLSREAISQMGTRNLETQTETLALSTSAPKINLQQESSATVLEIAVILVSLSVALWFLWRKFIAPKTRGCGSCGGKGKACASRAKSEVAADAPLKIGGGHHSTAPVSQQREDF